MFIQSIRWRLLGWVAFLLVAVLSGFGTAVYQLQRLRQLTQLDQELERRVGGLSLQVRRSSIPPSWADHAGPPPEPPPGFPPDELPPRFVRPLAGLHRPPPTREISLPKPLANLFAQEGPDSFYFAIWGREGTLMASSTNTPAGIPLPRKGGQTRDYSRFRAGMREAVHYTELGDCILVGSSMESFDRAMNRFIGLLLVAGGGVLALGLGGAWWLAGTTIRPITQISDAASRISAGNLSERINVASTENELGHLAAVLNSTFERLEAAFAQEKRFTADASHELRTPLAVLITEAQTTLARKRTAAEYQETVEGCLSTAQQMRRLVESLLELARLDAGQQSMQFERFNLSATARKCVDLVQPLALARQIKIGMNLEAVEVQGDSELLSQVLINLLSNAVEYNYEGGSVQVSLMAEEDCAVLRVENTGPGIATEDLPLIFQRFHRGDKARSNSAGHSGLGLAIAKAVIEAHKGTIGVESRPEGRTTFTVRLPRS